MEVPIWLQLFFLSFFYSVQCPYPPTGDEVQMGSVLLPATRRGRYLANIVRRQAVDGTGIKFNKDADRMNAEAKKKVDVLSDELLPYIIAEQERRTTLYKRVMTAIQNGEKGITIAEIRNKPPLLIKRGLMYRCPANRAPKEPDGSGVLLCDDDIEPTQVMYDSCLSAEDKDLYVADNKYFFCNRKRNEGPDLPRNGSTPIGCAPIERTSFNYTSSRCSLEDTDDVVVHYRYYPDRTYKYVTELDPDREVCDHWNPCQIGYIYSLPGTDQAIPANELWPEYVEKPDEFEKDEIVQPIAEDSLTEFVPPNATEYRSSARRIPIPEGYNFSKVITGHDSRRTLPFEFSFSFSWDFKFVITSIFIRSFKMLASAAVTFYTQFVSPTGQEKRVPCLKLQKASVFADAVTKNTIPGRPLDNVTLSYTCNGCVLQRILLRRVENSDSPITYVDASRYEVKKNHVCLCSNKILMPRDFGDYFGVFKNRDGAEERIKLVTINAPEDDNEFNTSPVKAGIAPGGHFEDTVSYSCDGCEIVELLCNGESVLNQGRVTIVPESQMISFNFPRFEDVHACVYIVIFKKTDGMTSKKIIAELQNTYVTIPEVQYLQPPPEGDQFITEVPFICSDCAVTKVTVNGIELVRSATPGEGVCALYEATDQTIRIKITEFSRMFLGTYQATFIFGDTPITKTILDISDGVQSKGFDESQTKPSDTEAPDTTPATEDTTAGETTTAVTTSAAPEGDPETTSGADASSTAGDEASSTAAGDETTTAAGEAPAGDGEAADGGGESKRALRKKQGSRSRGNDKKQKKVKKN